jgi:hypothetical protein
MRMRAGDCGDEQQHDDAGRALWRSVATLQYEALDTQSVCTNVLVATNASYVLSVVSHRNKNAHVSYAGCARQPSTRASTS